MSLPKSNPLDIVSAHQTMSERLGEAASQARSALRQGISKFKRTRTFDGQPATIASSYVDMLVAAEEKWEPAYIRYGLPRYYSDEEESPDLRRVPQPAVEATVCCYNEASCEMLEVPNLHEYLVEWPAKFEEDKMKRWIHISGRDSSKIAVRFFQDLFKLHPLAAACVGKSSQTPKLIVEDETVFILTQSPALIDANLTQVSSDQVCIFVPESNSICVTFQDDESCQAGTTWVESITKRIVENVDEIRGRSSFNLLNVITRLILDKYFPLLEVYGDRLEDLETELMSSDLRKDITRAISRVKRDLLKLRRILWPMRECIADMLIMVENLTDDDTRKHTQELHEHLTYLADIMDTYRDVSISLVDLHLSAQDHKTQQVMRYLSIIASTFMPFTFLAGVYGMNFDNIPEYALQPAYFAFWLFVLCAAVFIVSNLQRWKWL